MELDLTGLLGLKNGSKEPQNATVQASRTESEQRETTEQTATGRLQREADEHQQEREQARSVYKAYQDNIRRSGTLQSEILKGIHTGENSYRLLLKAAEAISLMVGDSGFFANYVSENIRAIHGVGLAEPEALELELEAVQERLGHLKEAQKREGEPADELRRITTAIKAHEAREATIKKLMDKRQ